MKRNPLNTNHQLLHGDHFQGYLIQIDHGQLITNHLRRIHDCLYRSLDSHSNICVMRLDLFVPGHFSPAALCSNEVITKFIASMRAKIENSQEQSRNQDRRVHDADMRYMWCREITSNGRVHFHVALVFNRAAYAYMGKFDLERENMYVRIHEAWASALGMLVDDLRGYVHIPKNSNYQIIRGNEDSFRQAFFRVSYLAKMQTKEYNQGFHTFGCSYN